MNVTRLCTLGLIAMLTAGIASAQDADSSSSEPHYIGDQVCAICHDTREDDDGNVLWTFDDYMLSGHPWKLNLTAGRIPADDRWPHTPVPPLPPDENNSLAKMVQWSDVEYVIGNFFWKARFVDRNGFIITGDKVQWNIADQEFVAYHAGETGKPFDCGRCHTTGYQPDGHQHGLEGLIGTWTQPGIRCEACHGPGSEHVASLATIPPPGGKACSDCHYRDEDFRMPWKGGFMRHHQQAEDLSHSPHAFYDCTKCHEPHKSVVYNLGGTIKACGDCHPGNEENNNYVVHGMESLACVDCHMANIGKSAAAVNEFTGDVRGHLFRIMTDPIAAEDNVYEDGGSLFWNQDENGDAAITLDYACLGCHINFDPDFSLEQAAAFAKGIHARKEHPPETGDDWVVRVPLLYVEFPMSLEEFAGILMVKMTLPDSDPTIAIGMELEGGVIFWMDISGSLFFGNVNHEAGTMSGIVFNFLGTSSMWFAEEK